MLKGDGTKVTERAQNADFRRKPQIFADSPLLLEIQAFGGRRKPQIVAGNRRFSQKTAGNRRLGSVTLGVSPFSISSALGLAGRGLALEQKMVPRNYVILLLKRA